MHFRKRKGYHKVLRGDFALEESVSGGEIDRSQPWVSCIRRGMKIDMSMKFA